VISLGLHIVDLELRGRKRRKALASSEVALWATLTRKRLSRVRENGNYTPGYGAGDIAKIRTAFKGNDNKLQTIADACSAWSWLVRGSL
jgi:hypothetical protein